MEIEVEQEKLTKALNAVSRVAAGARATLPVLNNVLIKVEKKKATLTTTNLDMGVVDYLPTSKAVDGVVTVPARLLAEFVSNLPKGIVKIVAKNDKVTVISGQYNSVLNATPADDFPELPGIDEKKAVKFKIGIEDFKSGLSQVMVAASNDMTRPALTGVYFNTYKKALYIAATDGYRLADKKFINKVESEVKAIVPVNSLTEVMRSISEDMDEVEILFDDAQVVFRLGEIEITSKLIDGSFPNYRELIPIETDTTMKIKKDELMRVTKLAALFAREVGGSIICEAKKSGSLVVSSIANEFGENASEIETVVDKAGKVTLNSRFLIDALNSLGGDEIEMGFSGTLAPIKLEVVGGSDYTHIIMPLKN